MSPLFEAARPLELPPPRINVRSELLKAFTAARGGQLSRAEAPDKANAFKAPLKPKARPGLSQGLSARHPLFQKAAARSKPLYGLLLCL